MPETKVTAIYFPEERELTLFKWACRVTAGKPEKPVSLPSTKLILICSARGIVRSAF